MAYNLKSEEEVKEFLENLGIEYRFSCYGERNPEGCHLLGDYLESISKDYKKASQVYKMNCDELNYGRSCCKYAIYTNLGKGGCEPNAAAELQYFEKGCLLNDAKACLLSGTILTDKTSEHKDYIKGLRYFEKACNGNNAEGCYFASGCHIKGNEWIPQNMNKAFYYSTKGCELGNAYACANLSLMYKKGEGVAQNEELSLKYRKIATEIQDQHLKQFQGLKFGE